MIRFLCVSLCTKNANEDYTVFCMQYVIAIVCDNFATVMHLWSVVTTVEKQLGWKIVTSHDERRPQIKKIVWSVHMEGIQWEEWYSWPLMPHSFASNCGFPGCAHKLYRMNETPFDFDWLRAKRLKRGTRNL